MKLNSLIVVISVIGIATPALAAGPALLAPSGKLGAYVARDGSTTARAATGSVTAPLGQQFGVQFDGQLGHVEGATFKTAGGQLFWRDPETAMVGLTAEKTVTDGPNATGYGATAALYLNNTTLTAWAGQLKADGVRENYYTLSAGYYTSDQTELRASYTKSGDYKAYGATVEHQLHSNATGFAQLGRSDGQNVIAAGIEITFGAASGASLKTQHRQYSVRNYHTGL